MEGHIHWSPGVTLEALEKQAIQKAFQFFHKNKTQTASALGISIRTLEAKLEKYHEQDVQEAERIHNEREQQTEYLNRARGEKTPNYQWSSGIEPRPETTTISPDRSETPKEDRRGESVPPVTSGLGMESTVDAREESSLSVPEWEEVQEVSSEHTAKSNPKRARKAV